MTDQSAEERALRIEELRARFLAASRFVGINFAVLAGILLFGLIGTANSLPSSYSSLIWPPGGIAVAACMLFGRDKVIAGIFLAYLLLNMITTSEMAWTAFPWIVALGSVTVPLIVSKILQSVDTRLTLVNFRIVMQFAAGSAIACVLSAAVGTCATYEFGLINRSVTGANFFDWWFGDYMGVLIYTPIVMALLSRGTLWKLRRIKVVLPVAFLLLFGMVLGHYVVESNKQTVANMFENETETIVNFQKNNSDQNQQMVHDLVAFFESGLPIDAAAFKNFAAKSMGVRDGLVSLGWNPIVMQADTEKFEQEMTRQLGKPFHIWRIGNGKASPSGEQIVVGYMEPANEALRGADNNSDAMRSRLYTAAREKNRLTVSPRIKLMQDQAGPGGIIMAAPLHDASHKIIAFAVAVFNFRSVTEPLEKLGNLSWKIIDLDDHHSLISQSDQNRFPEFSSPYLFAKEGIYTQKVLTVGDRHWQFIFFKAASGNQNQLMFSKIVMSLAMLITAMLSCFLLIYTGNEVAIAQSLSNLKTSEQRWSFALQGSGEGVWDWDVESDTMQYSARWREMLDYPDYDIFDSYYEWADRIHPEELDEVTLAVNNNLAGLTESFSIEHRCRKKDGDYLWIQNRGMVVKRDEQGAALRMVGTFSDISERKKMERIKGNFISTVSHELRTPLTSIRGALALLESGVLGAIPDKALEILRIAHKNSQRLILLVNDILDMEKLLSGKMTYHLEAVHLVELINECIEENSSFALNYRVSYQLLNHEPAIVLADVNRLKQVMANLMSNAAKFSPPDSVVEINFAKQDQCYRVTVEDHGDGIPEEFQPRMFQAFSQASSGDTRQQGGTGLGLNISQRIVQEMSGDMGYTTEAGVGTQFWITLPVPASS